MCIEAIFSLHFLIDNCSYPILRYNYSMGFEKIIFLGEEISVN
jgi:hypothetical protein